MAARMPDLIRPMLATLGAPPTGPGWGWEWKWDGVRAIAYLDGRGRVRLMTRNDRDVTETYPELGGLTAGPATVLDGEIVALDETGAPSFARLQNRMHVRAPTSALLRAVPVRYYVFDVLWHAGRDLTHTGYAARRETLESLSIEEAEVPPSFTGDGVNGDDLLRAAAEQNLEGVIAKHLNSRYDPGRRSPSWIKTPLARTQEVIIVGWKPGGGRRSGLIGSLLLAGFDHRDRLHYLGNVGTGFTERMLRDLAETLAPLARPTAPLEVPRPDAREAHWVEPTLVAEVRFRTWTPEGRLRHPSYRGLRPDREPAEVRVDVN